MVNIKKGHLRERKKKMFIPINMKSSACPEFTCRICANDIHYILRLLGGKTEVWIPASKLLRVRVMLYISKDTIAIASDVLFYSADAQVQSRGRGV